MTENLSDNETRDEEAFNALLTRLVNTPPKPHVNGVETKRPSKKVGDAPAKNRRPPEVP